MADTKSNRLRKMVRSVTHNPTTHPNGPPTQVAVTGAAHSNVARTNTDSRTKSRHNMGSEQELTLTLPISKDKRLSAGPFGKSPRGTRASMGFDSNGKDTELSKIIKGLRGGKQTEIILVGVDIDDVKVKSLLDVIPNCNSVRRVKLKQNNLTDDNARQLIKYLCRHNNAIEQWIVKDNGALTPFTLGQITTMIIEPTDVTHIDFSYTQFSTDQVQSLVDILAKNKLLSLKLEGCPLGAKGFDALLHALQSNVSLTVLHVGAADCNIVSLSKFLHKSSNLLELSLRHTKLEMESVRSLASALTFDRTLETLDLSYTGLDVAMLDVICKGIQKNGHVQSFKIAGNTFNDGWLESLLSMLHESLTEINISRCDLKTGLSKLISNTKLKRLEAKGNPWTLSEFKAVSEALTVNKSLIYLGLSKCRALSADELNAIAGSIGVTTTLTEIDLRENDIQDEAAKDLLVAVQVNRSLRKVRLTGNKLTSKSLLSFEKALCGDIQVLNKNEFIEVVEFIVESHVEDPRWTHITSSDPKKRKKLIQSTTEEILKWCNTHSKQIFVRRKDLQDLNKQSGGSSGIAAVTVWSGPGDGTPEIPKEKVLLKLAMKLATGTATRYKNVINGLEAFIQEHCNQADWQLIFCEVRSKAAWDDVLNVVFKEADKKKQKVWTCVTEESRIALLKVFGFEVTQEKKIAEDQIKVWGLTRNPKPVEDDGSQHRSRRDKKLSSAALELVSEHNSSKGSLSPSPKITRQLTPNQLTPDEQPDSRRGIRSKPGDSSSTTTNRTGHTRNPSLTVTETPSIVTSHELDSGVSRKTLKRNATVSTTGTSSGGTAPLSIPSTTPPPLPTTAAPLSSTPPTSTPPPIPKVPSPSYLSVNPDQPRSPSSNRTPTSPTQSPEVSKRLSLERREETAPVVTKMIASWEVRERDNSPTSRRAHSPRAGLSGVSSSGQSLYSAVISCAKTVLVNCNRINVLCVDSIHDILTGNEVAIGVLGDVIGNLETLTTKLKKLLEVDLRSIDEIVFNSIEGEAADLFRSLDGLITLVKDIKNPENAKRFQSMNAQERSNNIKQCYLSVNHSIKELINGLERGKLADAERPTSPVEKRITSLPVSAKEPALIVPAPQPGSAAPAKSAEKTNRNTAAKPFHPTRPLSSYDPVQVKVLQCMFKKQVGRARWRNLVKEYKDTPTAAAAKHRNMILLEFLSTEESYVKGLEIIINHYLKPLREKSEKHKLATKREVTAVFSSIEIIHQVNAQLLARLKFRFKNKWPREATFADLLIEALPAMKLYIDYVNNFDEATSTLKKLSEQKDFVEFIEECKTNTKILQDLSSLLITPIQRTPRYELLIRELLKETPESHQDYENLQNAKRMIEKTNKTINAKKQEQETRRKLYEIEGSIISSAPMLLLAPHRLYVRDGPLQFTHKGQLDNLGHVFLLNDIMLLTKTKREKDRKGEVTRYVYVTTINLKNCEIKDTGKTSQFYLIQDRDQWEFYCQSEANKQEWMAAIHETIETLILNELLEAGAETGSKPFSVLKATYGVLKDPTQIADVTTIVQDIVKQQGGNQLVLNVGSKVNIFGNPAKTTLKKKKLSLVYSLKGAIKSQTFGDNDAIKLPEKY